MLSSVGRSSSISTGLPSRSLISTRSAWRYLGQHVQSADLPLVPLNLAEPVLGPSDQSSEHALCHAATSTVERDPFPDGQLVSGASHELRVGRALPEREMWQ